MLTEPTSFREALQMLSAKKIMPTDMTSRELMQLAAEVREASFFSAQTNADYYLNKILDLVTADVEGKLDRATFRLRAKEFLKEIGYEALPEERGTITDLASDARINLVAKMNVEAAQGYGQWRQGQDATIVDLWPAQELFRAESRKEPRDWQSRWVEHGGVLYAGRMIALKDDEIWTAISVFGLPYPPFDFGSGMWTRDISRDEAVELGVMTEDQTVEPQRRPFEMGMAA